MTAQGFLPFLLTWRKLGGVFPNTVLLFLDGMVSNREDFTTPTEGKLISLKQLDHF